MRDVQGGWVRGGGGESLVIRALFGCVSSAWAMCRWRSAVNLNVSISFSGSWAFLPPRVRPLAWHAHAAALQTGFLPLAWAPESLTGHSFAAFFKP